MPDELAERGDGGDAPQDAPLSGGTPGTDVPAAPPPPGVPGPTEGGPGGADAVAAPSAAPGGDRPSETVVPAAPVTPVVPAAPALPGGPVGAYGPWGTSPEAAAVPPWRSEPTAPQTPPPGMAPMLPVPGGPAGPGYPGAPEARGGGAAGGDRRARPLGAWLAVAAVAALIGGAVGAVVTWAAGSNGSSNGPTLTIHEGNAKPGAAVVSGNVSIPKLVHQVLPAVVSIDVKNQGQEDQGTGMILSSNGEVMTNNHVVALAEGGGTITVTESGTTKAQSATLVGADPSKDAALLQIKGASGLPTITFGNSDKLVVGDGVVAIGNALGLAAGTPTVTQGIVSALGRTVTAGDQTSTATETLTDMIQTDAAINPGNSGGPLIDTAGQVIGMNTAVAGASSDGSSAQNIGFAIPSSTLESLLGELQKGGTINTGGGVIGVDVTTLTTQLQQQYGFTPTQGAVILSVLPGSPAARAGLQQGDVIVAVDGKAVNSADQLQSVLAKTKPGQTVPVTYYVGNLKETKSLTLESQSQEHQQAQSAGGSSGAGRWSRGAASAGWPRAGADHRAGWRPSAEPTPPDPAGRPVTPGVGARWAATRPPAPTEPRRVSGPARSGGPGAPTRWRTDDHHRTAGVGHTLLAHRAQQEPDEPSPAPRAQDQEVGILGGVDERLAHVAFGHEQGHGHDGVRLHRGHRAHQELLGQARSISSRSNAPGLSKIQGICQANTARISPPCDLRLVDRPPQRGVGPCSEPSTPTTILWVMRRPSGGGHGRA